MSSPEKPRISLKQAKIEAACSFILQHPSAKDFEVIEALKCSRRTVAYARADLVEKGLLPAPRKRPERKPAPAPPLITPDMVQPPKPEEAAETKADYSGQLVTPSNVEMLVATVDDDDETDAETQKRMMREAKRMAFDTRLHPDTRGSMMTLWMKLRDAAKARDLGPGVPLTRDSCKDRLKDILRAVGIVIVIECIEELWGNKKEATNASAVETPTSAGTEATAGTAGHEGSPATIEDLRTEHLDGGGNSPPSDEHHDLSGPTT
jgi:hypothetical protein